MQTKTLSAPGWAGAGYVLVFQSCLSFAYYGATANLVLLLQNYAGATESGAETLTNYFGAMVGLTPLLGGYLSDKVMGCFNTIILGASIFTMSLSAITIAVRFEVAKFLLLPTLFVLLPLGYGLLTANVNVFGAHQFESDGEKSSWFSWYYFNINIGSILAFLIPGMIQQSYSFFAGLCVPCVVIAFGILLLASARSKLLHPSSEEKSGDAEDLLSEKETTSSTQVWRKVLPAMLLTIIFSVCYCQMQTTWYVQGMWMDRNVLGVQVPVSYMMCADPLFVMLGIYLLEGFVFPYLRRMEQMPSPVCRMAIGMGCSCCGMYAAYHVERLRLQGVALHGDPSRPSPISMLLQIPQFAFVAFAEIFVYTTIMEYAFSLAPASMKSSINAVNIFMGCIANVIAGFMTTFCSSWIPPTNPNNGHYDRFYLLLGALCFVGGVGFHLLRETNKPISKKKASYGSA